MTFDIVLLGDSKAGKTAIFNCLKNPAAASKLTTHSPTMGLDFHRLVIKESLGGNKLDKEENIEIPVMLYDMGGQERYKSLSESSYLKEAKLIILVVDPNSLAFFDETDENPKQFSKTKFKQSIKKWFNYIQRVRKENSDQNSTFNFFCVFNFKNQEVSSEKEEQLKKGFEKAFKLSEQAFREEQKKSSQPFLPGLNFEEVKYFSVNNLHNQTTANQFYNNLMTEIKALAKKAFTVQEPNVEAYQQEERENQASRKEDEAYAEKILRSRKEKKSNTLEQSVITEKQRIKLEKAWDNAPKEFDDLQRMIWILRKVYLKGEGWWGKLMRFFTGAWDRRNGNIKYAQELVDIYFGKLSGHTLDSAEKLVAALEKAPKVDLLISINAFFKEKIKLAAETQGKNKEKILSPSFNSLQEIARELAKAAAMRAKYQALGLGGIYVNKDEYVIDPATLAAEAGQTSKEVNTAPSIDIQSQDNHISKPNPEHKFAATSKYLPKHMARMYDWLFGWKPRVSTSMEQFKIEQIKLIKEEAAEESAQPLVNAVELRKKLIYKARRWAQNPGFYRAHETQEFYCKIARMNVFSPKSISLDFNNSSLAKP